MAGTGASAEGEEREGKAGGHGARAQAAGRGGGEVWRNNKGRKGEVVINLLPSLGTNTITRASVV